MDAAETVALEITDHIAVVTLNRPESRNALNLPMCRQLIEIFRSLDSDADVRAVALRGAGPVFCAGADLKERRDKDESWIRNRRVASFEAYRHIENCSKPVVALVHGAVVGSGGEMAMASDFIYASADARFKFPEVHWGTIGATQRLQRVIGKRKAKELLFTNGTLTADDAQRYGLVQRVFATDELFTRGLETTRTMAVAPAMSVRLTKQAIDLGSEVTLEQGIRIEMNAIEQNLADGAWRDGLTRFSGGHKTNDRAGEVTEQAVGAAGAGRE